MYSFRALYKILFHFQRLKQAIKPKIKTDNEEDFEGVDNIAMQTVRS